LKPGRGKERSSSEFETIKKMRRLHLELQQNERLFYALIKNFSSGHPTQVWALSIDAGGSAALPAFKKGEIPKSIMRKSRLTLSNYCILSHGFQVCLDFNSEVLMD
jgi:hypothetical protein